MNNTLIKLNFSVFKIENEFQEAFDFEVYDVPKTIELFKTYRPILYVLIVLYLAGVYFGQKWMSNRQAYDLKYPLFLWNAGLALFSIVATIRAYPQLFFLLAQPEPIYRIVCTMDVFNYATAFWALMFALSKIVELGDTAFVILRKHKLIFLHWYHHATMVVMSWLGFEVFDPIAQYYVLNTFVHSFMYSYYALRALHINIPRPIAMFVTLIQISQFVVGLYWNIPSFYWIANGVPCARDVYFASVVFFVGSSYLLLFLHFFVTTYIIRKNPRK